MTSLDPGQPSTVDGTMSLFERVLPAASANELLQRLAEAISAEALFVRRRRWPLWLGVRPWCGQRQAVEIFTDEDVPQSGRHLGPAVVIGGCNPLDDDAVAVLAKQIQLLDDRELDEKLEAMAELAAGAGHEVNNPLGSIVGRASLLAKGEADPDRLRTLAAIAAQAYRGRDMIGDLMLFARPPAPKPECVPFEPVVSELLSEFKTDLQTKELTVGGSRDAALSLWADATQLRIVLSELLRNAIRFAPLASAIEFNTVQQDSNGLLAITDNGPTLTPAEKRHLFDPFYSGRQAGRGLGFGLSKCWRIVTLHGGAIAHDDVSGRNRFSVIWPARNA